MSKTTVSTRRSFLKGGAIAAAPLAAAAPAAMADDGRLARLQRLEDEAAIRALHQDWLRGVNAGRGAGLEGAVRAIAADLAGAPDVIEIAADGRTAAGRYACAVESESALSTDCTFAQMAHFQGDGVVRSLDRRVLSADYVKGEDGWAIARIGFA